MGIPFLPIILIGKIGLATGITLLGSRFASKLQSSNNYVEKTPKFEMSKHFSGKMKREGLMHGALGKVSKTFVSSITINWNGKQGHMTEIIKTNDGDMHTQNWTLFLIDEKTIKGRGDDIEGEITGELSGNSMLLKYALRLPKKAGGYIVNVEDWYYALDNGTIVNRAQYNKLGYPLGDVAATLQKV